MKVYVNRLTNAELKKVYEANAKIRSSIMNMRYEDEMFYAMEIIDSFDRACIDYCLGYDRGTFIKCMDEKDFIDGCVKAHEDFGLFDDEEYDIVKEVIDLYRIMESLDLDYDIDTSSVEEGIEARCKMLADIMDAYFTACFEDALFNDTYGAECFCEWAYENYLDCYINDEDNNYILYRDTVEIFK